MTQLNDPPPLPDQGNAVWHYVEAGRQNGPVTTSQIQDTLRSKTLDPESQVWRTGMNGWKSVRETELVITVADVPPPIPSDQIRNALVWIVALLPLFVGIVDASLASQPHVVLERALAPHMGGSYREPGIPWQIHAAVNSALLFWDERRLNKAGYSSKWMTGFAIGLAPVYLFLRAKRLNQRPSYAITWVALSVISAFLVASVRA